MRRHDFIKDGARNYDYNSIFDKIRIVYVIFPAPTLFDFQRKQRHFIYESEAREYNTVVEDARMAEDAAQRASTSYHFDYYPDQRWWLST